MGFTIWLNDGQTPPGKMYLFMNLFGGDGLSTTPIVCSKNNPSFLRSLFIDLKNIYEPSEMKAAGFEYFCVGRS